MPSPSIVVTARPSARKGGRDAAVYRCSVEPHCARPAVPAVASLLHSVVSEVPKKRPETLSRERLLVELPVVHRVAHDWLPVSSFRSSSA